MNAYYIIVKYYSPYTNVAILRVSRDHFRHVWTALTFMTNIKSRPCIIRVLHVGGTIKLVQNQALVQNKQMLVELKKTHEFQGINMKSQYNVHIHLRQH